MAFVVEVAATAMRDAEEYHAFILKQSHDNLPADDWLLGLFHAIATLEALPARCPRIPEQKDFTRPLHQLLYASHRIVFQVEADRVNVLRIYHASLRPLKSLNQRPKLKAP